MSVQSVLSHHFSCVKLKLLPFRSEANYSSFLCRQTAIYQLCKFAIQHIWALPSNDGLEKKKQKVKENSTALRLFDYVLCDVDRTD